MKKYRWHHTLTALLFLSVWMGTGCLKDKCTSYRVYQRYDPVMQAGVDFRTGLTVEAPRELQLPGKIYAWGQYLFIGERNEGVHVIDNSDPANPQKVAFWRIQGNADIAIRGHYLYADQYVDLLTIDLSEVAQPVLVCRKEEAFYLHGKADDGRYITHYEPVEEYRTLDCSDERSSWSVFPEGDLLYSAVKDGSSTQSSGVNNSVSTGVGGSFARFGLANDMLYTLDQSYLKSWGLSNPLCPNKLDSTWAGGAETLFPWRDRLFVGTPTGLLIYNNSNPAHPVFETGFSHARGCDPVVCDDNYAYVTVRGGTTCGGVINQLEVLDIRQLPQVSSVAVYPMQFPKGVGILGDYLFVCDNGLKTYNRSQPADLKQLSHLKNINTYDVIPLSQQLVLVTGDDGFYQIDLSDPDNPKVLSSIPVKRP